MFVQILHSAENLLAFITNNALIIEQHAQKRVDLRNCMKMPLVENIGNTHRVEFLATVWITQRNIEEVEINTQMPPKMVEFKKGHGLYRCMNTCRFTKKSLHH